MSKKLLILILIVIVIIGSGLIYTQSITPKEQKPTESSSQPDKVNRETPLSLPSPSAEDTAPLKEPFLTAPQPNMQVSSPLTVSGSVPPGWMFEGVFPVKLLDAEKNVIAQTQGQEIKPGSWNSGNDVAFRATLEFATSAKSGFVVLEKDNPSGIPENAASHEIPVTF